MVSAVIWSMIQIEFYLCCNEELSAYIAKFQDLKYRIREFSATSVKYFYFTSTFQYRMIRAK